MGQVQDVRTMADKMAARGGKLPTAASKTRHCGGATGCRFCGLNEAIHMIDSYDNFGVIIDLTSLSMKSRPAEVQQPPRRRRPPRPLRFSSLPSPASIAAAYFRCQSKSPMHWRGKKTSIQPWAQRHELHPIVLFAAIRYRIIQGALDNLSFHETGNFRCAIAKALQYLGIVLA